MTKNLTTICNIITYPISTAHQGFLEFEHQIGHIAQKGDDFAKINIDPYVKYAISPLQYYKNVITSPEAQNIIDSSTNFAVCRLPNHKEAITNVLTQTTINFFAGRAKSAFGNNPTASAILRDISKLPSIEAQVAENNDIGFSETKYELGSLYASRTKVACKATILVAYSGYKFIYPSESEKLEKEAFQLVARVTNYICEIPSRYLHIADKRKQAFEKQNPDMLKKEFFNFLTEDYEISWTFEAVGEAMVKTTTSDQLGELARHFGYEAHIKEAIGFVDNVIASAFLGPGVIMFDPQDDVYSKALKYIAASSSAAIASGSIPRAVSAITLGTAAFFATTIVDFSGQLIIETTNTYTLGTPTRTCQDAAGMAIKNSYHLIQDMIDSYQNQTPLAGENGEL